jgi:hypothetical protein
VVSCASILRFLLGGVDGGVEGGGMLLSMGDSIGRCPGDVGDRGAWEIFGSLFTWNGRTKFNNRCLVCFSNKDYGVKSTVH